MADVKEYIALASIILGSGLAFVALGGLELAGTQASNGLCGIPGISSTSYCSASTQPSDKYKLTNKVSVNRNSIIETSHQYKTAKASGLLFSFTGDELSILTEGKNLKIDYYLREEGTLVASSTKRIGTVGTVETKDVTFSNNVDSGTYEVEYVLKGEQCNFLGCSDVSDRKTFTAEVPKLPLGEY